MPWQGGTKELRDSEFVLREELIEIVKSGRPGDDKIPSVIPLTSSPSTSAAHTQVWSWVWAAEVDGDEGKEMSDAMGWLRNLPVGRWQGIEVQRTVR